MAGLTCLLRFTSVRTAVQHAAQMQAPIRQLLSYKADQEGLKNHAKSVKNLSRNALLSLLFYKIWFGDRQGDSKRRAPTGTVGGPNTSAM
jgi:hypothetical protein